jgi:hypothetical protein
MKKFIGKLRYWWFNKKLFWVAKFIENHKLFPVNLDKELLEVWKRDGN